MSNKLGKRSTVLSTVKWKLRESGNKGEKEEADDESASD